MMNKKIMGLVIAGGAIIFGSLLSGHINTQKKRRQKLEVRIENLKGESETRRLQAG